MCFNNFETQKAANQHVTVLVFVFMSLPALSVERIMFWIVCPSVSLLASQKFVKVIFCKQFGRISIILQFVLT